MSTDKALPPQPTKASDDPILQNARRETELATWLNLSTEYAEPMRAKERKDIVEAT